MVCAQSEFNVGARWLMKHAVRTYRPVTESLFRNINRVLDDRHGLLILYGPYKINGQFSGKGDEQVCCFELKNPQWKC